MCGIVGYISKKDKAYVAEKAHFMRFALALDTLRGQDSTGIMTLSKKFEVDIMKSLMPGDRFVQSDRFRKKWQPGWAQVGHNRAATVGNVDIANAHPFKDGPITLVHNGTLWAKGTTLPKVNHDLEVDSQQIAHNFAEHYPDEAAEVLGEIDGAFALVWFDERDESINMVRNDERPLHYCVGAKRDIVWFMSDGGHLTSINRSFGKRGAAGASIFSLEKHKMLKFKKGSLVPEVTAFDPFVPLKRGYGNSSPSTSGTKTKTKGKTSTSTGKTALERATAKWEKNVQNYNGRKASVLGYPLPTVHLAGHNRLVPRPSLAALMEEYELTQNDYVKFTPTEDIELSDKERLVIGEIEHPLWGNCPWPAVVMNAKRTHVNAYFNTAWVVRPIGIGHPWNDHKHAAPSVMVFLEHCDWEGFKAERLAEREAQDEGKASAQQEDSETPLESGPTDQSTDSSDAFVKGPQGLMVPFKRAQSLLKNGCISCGYVSKLGELERCEIVNEGRDLLCGGCVSELRELTIPQEPKTSKTIH